MQAERRLSDSTGETALGYPAAMRISNSILPALLLILVASFGCKEEPSANTPGEFGDACIPGANADTPDGCVDGTECYVGYCEEKCVDDSDCQQVDGWNHACVAGLCHLLCDDNKGCPSNLGATLTCGVIGTSRWCEAEDDES